MLGAREGNSSEEVHMLKSADASGRSLGTKLILICLLVLVMAVPIIFIYGISFDRSSRAADVTGDVSQRYGGRQYIAGPVLIAPYYRLGREGKVTETGEYAISPEEGSIDFRYITTEIKKRSLFRVPVYQADGEMTARFAAIDRDKYTDRTIEWDKARLIIGLSDGRGLTEDIALRLPSGEMRNFEPDSYRRSSGIDRPYEMSDAILQYEGWGQSADLTFFSVPAADILQTGSAFTVTSSINIRGARELGALPFAKSTRMSMTSDWASPGFKGGFAPEQQNITDTGFTASWFVSYLARGVPGESPVHQMDLFDVGDKAVTVQFVSELNPYQTVNRALKYSILFIGLVFITFFLFEVLVGRSIHSAQYILVGLAQGVFYLLLLAFSEYIGFTPAFGIAALATVVLTAAYAGAVFGGWTYVIRAGIVFGIIYGLLFVLMRLQDFALLIGALTSFTAIALIMYVTGGINWYGGRERDNAKP